MYNYYFAVASQSFLLNQEPIEEILRERINYYEYSNKEIDFWLILNPNFFNDIDKPINIIKNKKPLAAIVSLDRQFIEWLKLRMVFVYTGSFKSNSVFMPENI
uniref:Ycf54 n=1 Tax=Tolypiocladia glomerulata TaxID=860646 RepID=A0A1Z1MUL7_9FLOR|nr:hypothetical protein [Tolypiocladia glomerulata]ARW69656.1 hypothetical protein [Tolypiocladia glomerulata]